LAGIAPERLEIVGDVFTVPWTILCDQAPDPAAFAGDGGWQSFWGRRYDLTGGRRVQWLRGRDLPAQPSVVLALDPVWRGRLPAGNVLAVFERFAGVGLIGAWQPAAAATANRCGLELLQALAYDRRSVAEALGTMRQHHPLAGLLYFACCPADVRAVADDGELS